ncbi:unnamed protein product, partial [Tenebrio molitor]
MFDLLLRKHKRGQTEITQRRKRDVNNNTCCVVLRCGYGHLLDAFRAQLKHHQCTGG